LHNQRCRFDRFAILWALLLAQILYACASGTPEDGSGGERLGRVTQAFCTGGFKCGGNGDDCCPSDDCCGQTCIKAGTPSFCCSVGHICSDGTPCADGVCCNSACDGKCQACGSDGVCRFIAAGSDPGNECASVANSCATGDSCNGAGACQFAASSWACAATTCSNGQVTGSLCNGSGTCVSSTSNCSPYLCAGNGCGATCAGDGDCVANGFCRTSDHTCQLDQANGVSCSGNSQCVSAHCVDGVCCESSCAGTCQACSAAKKGSGLDGFCENVAKDSDPDGNCPDDGAASCGSNGSCDGNGACSKYGLGVSCGSNTCTNGQQSGHSCDGFGTCADSSVVVCSPFTCSGSACATQCNSDANCVASAYCDSNKDCKPDQANGNSCTLSSQCTSGNCVDGFCCDTACDGTCDACSAAKKGSGTDGTCGAIAAGADPDSECADDGAATCKKDGTCNGNHGCRLYGSGIACGSTTCSSGTQTGHACNGLGTCNPSTSDACSPYVCADTSKCAKTCASDAGCVANSYCAANNTCQADQNKGAICTAASQCTSGNCVDGFCCDAPCSGACQACSAAKTGGTNGTCKAITLGTDPDGDCPDDGTPSCDRNGVCDGVGACQKYANGTACGSTTCSAGMQAGQSCDGAGNCKASQATSCSPYVCSGTACGSACVSDADCITSAYCDAASHCVADQGNGKSCTKASQCANGNCVDGVCCDQACAGGCQACSAAKKGTGNDGVCGNVVKDSDPDNDCSADAPTSCKNDGGCDGKGACKKYDSGTACGATQCSGSQLTGRQCDGLGNCVNGQTSSCAPYVCLTSTCATGCGDDNGCVGGSYCAGSECKDKQDNGNACSSNHECGSGFCVESVCCDTACNGVCQACTAANKASGPDGSCGLAKPGTDAHGDCDDEGAISCKRNGSCDGAGACSLYDNGIACGITSCEGNVQTGFACDGSGKCNANATSDCDLYACMSGACKAACADNGDCNENAYCDVALGTCKKKEIDGTKCDGPGTCASGYCVDEVCCNKVCGEQCQACDVATAPGTCSPIVGTPHGIRPKCDPGTPDDVCSARACDGEQDIHSCVGYVGAETSCRDQTCADGVETFSASCDGAGECGPAGPVKTKKCEPYVCQGSGCGAAPCGDDQDCAPKFRCDLAKEDCVPRDVASCDGDHVIGNPDGTTTDCAPFKCEGSVCKESCASVDDCVSGFVCDGQNHCVAAQDSGASGAGCGCRVAAGGKEPTRLLLLLLGLGVLRRSRRLRRRKHRLQKCANAPIEASD
jgi:hypothetical protein